MLNITLCPQNVLLMGNANACQGSFVICSLLLFYLLVNKVKYLKVAVCWRGGDSLIILETFEAIEGIRKVGLLGSHPTLLKNAARHALAAGFLLVTNTSVGWVVEFTALHCGLPSDFNIISKIPQEDTIHLSLETHGVPPRLDDSAFLV